MNDFDLQNGVAVWPLFATAAIFLVGGVALAGRSESPVKLAIVSYLVVGIAIVAMQSFTGGVCAEKPRAWFSAALMWPSAVYDWTVVKSRPFGSFFTEGLTCEPLRIGTTPVMISPTAFGAVMRTGG